MKRAFLPPVLVLAVLLAFSLWNGRHIAEETARWRSQLAQSDALAQAGDWDGALGALQSGYGDWTACQTYLHIVSQHDAVDDAEAMYRRAAAFAATEEITEFRAEISDLRDQLRLIAEMEQLSIRNIL